VIEHTHDFDKAFSEMYRVLSKDGKLLLITPNLKSFEFWLGKTVGHTVYIPTDELKEMIEKAGFKIIEHYDKPMPSTYEIIAYERVFWCSK